MGREALADEQAWRAGVIEAGFWDALFRVHDGAAFAQAVLMIPVVRVLHSYVSRRAAGTCSPLALARCSVFFTYPVWSILTGRALLKSSETAEPR